MRIFCPIIVVLTIFSVAMATDFNVVFSEVYPNSSQEGTQFIELYNPLNYAINISGWTLESYSSSSESFSFQIPSGELIPNEGFYLIWIKPDDSATWPSGWVDPDATIEEEFLLSTDEGLRMTDDLNMTVDAVGWGSISDIDYYEECPVNNQSVGESIERKSGEDHDENGGNGYDTDNNYEDFRIRSNPEPQNTLSPSEYHGSIISHSIGLIKSFFSND